VDGVYVTAHEESVVLDPPTGDRMQVPAAEKVPMPAVPENVTEPVGAAVVPGDVSVTVAVQVDAWPTKTGPVQSTPVLVLRLVMPTDAVDVAAVVCSSALADAVLETVVGATSATEYVTVIVTSPTDWSRCRRVHVMVCWFESPSGQVNPLVPTLTPVTVS